MAEPVILKPSQTNYPPIVQLCRFIYLSNKCFHGLIQPTEDDYFRESEYRDDLIPRYLSDYCGFFADGSEMRKYMLREYSEGMHEGAKMIYRSILRF